MNKNIYTFLKLLIFKFTVILTLSYCATYNTTIYNPSKLNSITSWYIDFTYETGEFEQKITGEGEGETKIKRMGHPHPDLQLKDDIFFILMDKYGIPVVSDVRSASGFIRIHPVHFYWGGFKSLDVQLYDGENILIARTRIKNGNRNATFKDDDEFAEYCAKIIAKMILKRR